MSGTDLKQRLAAILAADGAGYSRLMAVNERGTVAALDTARGVFKSQIESHQGRVIDMAGDSVLAVFETAIGAVSAALAIQKQLKTLGADVSEDLRMRFRIGVHLGDVMEKSDGTVYGDGVNIAARLEGLAEPGGITVSGEVAGAVRGKLSASLINLGEHRLKNIPEPVNVFRVRTTDAGRIPAKNSIRRQATIGFSVVAALGIGAGVYYAWQPLEDERSRFIPTPLWRAPRKEPPIMLAETASTKAEVAAPAPISPSAAAPQKATEAAPPQANVTCEQLPSRSAREACLGERAASVRPAKAGRPAETHNTETSSVAASAAPSGTQVASAAPTPSAVPAAPQKPHVSENEALYQQALSMEDGGDVKGAIRVYRRAARGGSGKAAKRLGEIFYKGVPGIPRDYAESLQWYETARQLGETVEMAGKR